MKKSLYFREMYGRQNMLKSYALTFLLGISSPFRLILEPFLRKHMGERYFSSFNVITVGIVLLIIPFMGQGTLLMWYRYSQYDGYSNMLIDFLLKYTTWYAFVFAFLYYSNIRRIEIKRDPSVFDFGKFSLSSGRIHPFFFKLKIGGRSFTIREIETLVEPGLFFIGGLLLYLFGQNVGLLFIISSIVYSLSYFGAYYKGDNFVMDLIDDGIVSEEHYRGLVLDEPVDKTRGVRFYTHKPTSREDREKLSAAFVDDGYFVPVK